MNAATPASTSASPAAIASTDASNPKPASSAAPRKNPTPLTAFFEPVSSATQRNSAPSTLAGASSLTALFALIFARSLATPDTPCASATKAAEAATLHAGSSCVSASSAAICNPSPA